ncbi:MAG TPA: DNA alkylation repair protein [Thermoanaerobaculaceae bacterium]|nr:DNA alkylation repair protein [Thermoanaerobaculaceae bacterium]
MAGRAQADHLAARIEAELRRLADPERAEGAKRYLKSALEFIGVATPEFRRALRSALKAGPPLDRATLLAAATRLWARPVFELRAAAVELLDTRAALLLPEDAALVERLIREARTWALVDTLAAHTAGSLAERFPELSATLDRWARDPDFWVRRAAMLALLGPLRRGGGDFERFARYADAMLGEKEFFIRKAIGWVLREVSKKRPELVASFLAPRMSRASGVTLREALKYLPPEDRRRLLSAHSASAGRTRRPGNG